MTAGTSEEVEAARCAGWRAISFSAKGDTKQTISEIRTHNAVGAEKKCWN